MRLKTLCTFHPCQEDKDELEATITLALEESGTVEIYNIQGALVGSFKVEQGKNTLALDKSLTTSGVYIYKVYTGNQLRHTDKLVVVQ